MHGALCFAGTRVQVKSLFDYLRAGKPIGVFLEHFPTVERWQVEAVLRMSEERLMTGAA